MGTLAIDASTPAPVYNTTATITSASFTPPANSLLLIFWAGNTPTATTVGPPSITDNLGVHLTYTQLQHNQRSDGGTNADRCCSAFTAAVTTSQAMTISMTTQAATTQNTFKVFVLTDDSGQVPTIGASAKGSQITSGAMAAAFTATTTGSWGFAVCDDWDAAGAPTAGSGTTIAAGDSADQGTVISYAYGRRTTADGVASSTTSVNFTVITGSANSGWVAVEVIPAVGGGATPAVGFSPPFDYTPGLDGPSRLSQFQPDPRAIQAITRLTQDFNQGADGTAITAGNSVGTNEAPFDVVNAAPGDGFNKYDSSTFHDGPLSGLIQTTTTSGNPSWVWSTSMGAQTQVWGRFYLRVGAYPAAKNRIVNFQSSGTQCASIILDPTGLLGIRNNASTDALLTTAIPLNTWVRVEFRYQFGVSAGSATLRLYSANADASVPNFDDTVSVTGASFGAATADTYTFGQFAASASRGPWWWDSLELNNIDYPGPVAIYPASSPDVSVDAAFADSAGVAGDSSVNIDVNGDVGTATGTANDAGPSVQVNAECATATGAANDARVDLNAFPGNAAATGTAGDSVANVQPNADVATATGAANDATVSAASSTNANAECATATGTANDARIDIAVYPPEAQAAGTSNDGGASVSANADVATATGNASDARIDIGGYPPEAQATGAAQQPAVSIAVPADIATATSAAGDATANVMPSAGNASATGTANDVTRIDIIAYPTEAQATGTANDAAPSILVNAECATATGTANDATASTVTQTNANAECATATGTANDASISLAANAGVASATGTANDAAPSIAANADVATATGTAGAPTASVGASGDVGNATGTANDSAPSVAVNADVATATGTANDASVSASSPTNANAGVATATGTAGDATVNLGASADVSSATGVANDVSASLLVYAECATGTGTANDATASTVSNTSANAGVATATGVAGDATVSVGASPTEATASGTANDATVTISAQAGNAPATGIVDNPVGGPTASAPAGVASAVTQAYDVPVQISAGSLDAQALSEAYDASIDAVVTPTGGLLDTSFGSSAVLDGAQTGVGGVDGPAVKQTGAESTTGVAGATEGAMVAAGQQG